MARCMPATKVDFALPFGPCSKMSLLMLTLMAISQ